MPRRAGSRRSHLRIAPLRSRASSYPRAALWKREVVFGTQFERSWGSKPDFRSGALVTSLAGEGGFEAGRAELPTLQSPDAGLHSWLSAFGAGDGVVDAGHRRDLHVLHFFHGVELVFRKPQDSRHAVRAQLFKAGLLFLCGSLLTHLGGQFGVLRAAAERSGAGGDTHCPAVRAPNKGVGVLAVVQMDQISLAKRAAGEVLDRIYAAHIRLR